MALTVNTNTTSLNVQKNLNRASDALSTSMQRLSSGLKINSAKDDAAGLQIATRMTIANPWWQPGYPERQRRYLRCSDR